MEKGQDFCRAVAHIFMGILRRMPFQLPTFSRIRKRLVGSGFIFGPGRQPEGFAKLVGAFD
jgi:hypothetical protein